MPIVTRSGPEGGAERVGTALAAMSVSAPLGLEAEAGGSAEILVGQPIPIFAVDLEALASDGRAAVDSAHRTGWRYLAERSGGLSVVDLPEGPEREAELLMSQEVGGNLAASGNLAELITAEEGDYETRILDLNLIGDSVLWLRNLDGKHKDRFVTLGGEPQEVPEYALIERLQRSAHAKLLSMSAADGESGG